MASERDITNMKYFADFFASEVFKNKHNTLILKTKRLQKKKINCMTYSVIYTKLKHLLAKKHQCIIKICSVLNLGNP